MPHVSFAAHGKKLDQLGEHAIAIASGKGERELRDEQTV